MRPLEGTRVIDLSSFIAGSVCSAILAEFGADVIKVEPPGEGDPLRRMGPIAPGGVSFAWLSACRNERSITLDVRTGEGRDILKSLVSRSDMLLETFQPGTLESWGLGWEELKAVNPRLVLLRVSGFGQDGPLRDRPGTGWIGSAFGGLADHAGEAVDPTILLSRLPNHLAGLYGAIGCLLALQARDRIGRGQVVDLALYEAVLRTVGELGPLRGEDDPDRSAALRSDAVPFGRFATADGSSVALSCPTDRIFARLADAMNEPGLAGPESWGTFAARERDEAAVRARVESWTRSMRLHELVARCDQFQVPCAPVQTIADILADPHVAHRRNIAYPSDAGGIDIAVPNVQPRLSETPGRLDHLGPALGADNAFVFEDLLGLSKDRIVELQAAGIV